MQGKSSRNSGLCCQGASSVSCLILFTFSLSVMFLSFFSIKSNVVSTISRFGPHLYSLSTNKVDIWNKEVSNPRYKIRVSISLPRYRGVLKTLWLMGSIVFALLFSAQRNPRKFGGYSLNLSTNSVSAKTCGILSKLFSSDRTFIEIKFNDCALAEEGQLLQP